jgi:hypothetical protein
MVLWDRQSGNSGILFRDYRRNGRKGFQTIKTLWTPIFDEFDTCGIKFALEVHQQKSLLTYTPRKASGSL